MPIPPDDLLSVYATPRSALIAESADASALRQMKRKLRTVALQGFLVFVSCGLGGVGVVSGFFDPPGGAAIASTDPVQVLVVGALAVGAVSGLLGTATALAGSSMVAHWIEHLREDERPAGVRR